MIIWLSVLGLILDIIGVILLAKPLLKSKENIENISSYITINTGAILGKDYERLINKNLVDSLTKDNKIAKFGINILVTGFTLQILGILL